MVSLNNLADKQSDLDEQQIEWLQQLVLDWQLLADLAQSDVVLWVKNEKHGYKAVAHNRPAGAFTLFYRDVIGDYLREDWREIVDRAIESGERTISSSPTWYEEQPMRIIAYPVCARGNTQPFAVATVHSSPTEQQTQARSTMAFSEVAEDLFCMIARGLFPSLPGTRGGETGTPRASDGLIRVNPAGQVTFASPNAQTTLTKLGYRDELEGENFTEVVTEVMRGQFDTNESLPLVTAGKIAGRADVFARARTVTLRSIPITRAGEKVGAVLLTRDITELRQQAQELITKDATIREIHHRVKNNLQTVASLLRVQARRARSEEAKQVLGQAMRRVAAIAVVHDTLSTGLSQIVDFDVVFDRVLGLVTEVASLHNSTVTPVKIGEFGELPSDYATPLALALTEIVTNAVEHGLAGKDGEVTITAKREEMLLSATVSDTGTGLPGGILGDGLGTSIVRTLVEGELGGKISWQNRPEGGTIVSVEIPLQWLATITREMPRIIH